VVQGLQKVVTVARAPDARLTRRFSCSVFIVWLLWLCGAEALPLCFPPSLPCLDVRGEERRSASFSPSPPSLTQLAGGPTAPNLLLPGLASALASASNGSAAAAPPFTLSSSMLLPSTPCGKLSKKRPV
jgi:hypothetical protein